MKSEANLSRSTTQTWILALFLTCVINVPASTADLDIERLPDELAARQSAYLTKVETSAAEKYGKGTSDYYAALRQGLVRLGAALQANARGDASSFETTPATVERPVLARAEQERNALDRASIARIESEFEAAKAGARVVGGAIITVQSEFRDTVAFGKVGHLGCSGVVVHANAAVNATYVLTAAHCVCALGLQTPAADNTKLYIGTNIADPALFVALDFDGNVSMYPGSSCSGSTPTIRDKDLAIVRFKNNKPQADIRVATIASQQLLDDVLKDQESIYRIVGFGYQRQLNEFGVYQLGEIGQKAIGIIRRGGDCTGSAATLPGKCLRGEEIILNDSGNRVDTCAGDSGGPVYIKDASFTQFRLAAITSRSTHQSGSCGPGGVYGLVDGEALSWLQNTVKLPIKGQD